MHPGPGPSRGVLTLASGALYSYLSAALYSGNVTEGLVYASDAGYVAVPEGARDYFVHTSDNTHVLNMQQWAVGDLRVPPYPEARLYMQSRESYAR